MSADKSDFLPNSFQNPNAYVDRYMYLLEPEEYVILSYTVRRIIGFQKRSDRISLSQYENGTRAKDGTYLDHGTGLSREKIHRGLVFLIGVNLIIKVADNDPKKNEGAEYSLQLDSRLVRDDILLERYEKGKQIDTRRTEKARERAREKRLEDLKTNDLSLSDIPGSDPQIPPCDTDCPPLCGTDQPPQCPTDRTPPCGTDTQYPEENQGKPGVVNTSDAPVSVLEKIEILFGNPLTEAQRNEINKLIKLHGPALTEEVLTWFQAKRHKIDSAIERAKINLPTWNPRKPPKTQQNGRGRNQNGESASDVMNRLIREAEEEERRNGNQTRGAQGCPVAG
jgi:hypothetical protein